MYKIVQVPDTNVDLCTMDCVAHIDNKQWRRCCARASDDAGYMSHYEKSDIIILLLWFTSIAAAGDQRMYVFSPGICWLPAASLFKGDIQI